MSLQGKIVEYIDQSRFICGLVTGDSGKRLRVINQNGREMNLPLARVVHQTGTTYPLDLAREDIQRLLRETATRRQDMTALVNLDEIWELAVEEDESAFAPAFLAELSFGAGITDDHVAAFLRCVFIDKLFFKYKEGRIMVHSLEVVEQLKEKAARDKAREELLERGAKALQALNRGQDPGEWPEREKCLELLADYYLYANEAPESAVARDLLKRARLTRPHDPFQLLVAAGVWDKDENIPLLKKELPVEFSAEALEQAAVAEPSAAELLADGRRDLRHLELLTIDGADTRDFDDALHVEQRDDNFLVGIHIADVTPWIPVGSPLFNEALERGTSIYFPEGQIPMLPESLSQNVCSLLKDKPRPAVSFLVLLSPAGEVLEFELCRSVVAVKRQLSYDAAGEMIDHDESLSILARLSRVLQQKRVENGALLLPIPDVNITINEEVAVSISDVDTPARTLVAEFMVLANTLGAQYLCDREIPGLYRCQEPPRKRLYQGVEKDLFLNFRQRKFLSRGELLIKPRRHSGVGVPQYTTVTSPIRRLLDLIIEHQLVNALQGRGQLFSQSDCKDFMAKIIHSLSRANFVRQARHRYWILRYLTRRVGERLSAFVVDVQPRRIRVVIKDVLLETDLPLGRGADIEPGDVIRLTLARVDPLDNTLRLEW